MIKYFLATIIATALLKYFQISPLSFWETEGCVILTCFFVFILMRLQIIGHLFDLIRPNHKIYYYCKSCSKLLSDKKNAHTKRCPYCKKKTIRIIDKGSYLKFSPSLYTLKMIQKNDFVHKFRNLQTGKRGKSMDMTWRGAMDAYSKIGWFTDWCLPTKSNWMDIFHILDICNVEDVRYWTQNVDPDYPDDGAWCADPYGKCTGPYGKDIKFWDLNPGGERGYGPFHARLCRRKGGKKHPNGIPSN